MESKHTVKRSPDMTHDIIVSGDKLVARVYNGDAVKMAATDDLLDACKRVDSLYYEVERIVGGEVLEMLNQVRTAIAKATK